MDILKVKITQEGWLVNDSLVIPFEYDVNDGDTEKALSEWFANGNKAEPMYSSKEKKNLKIRNSISLNIYSFYPKDNQAQDLMWTNYFRTELVAQGETDVEQKVVGMVLAVQGGKSVDEALSGIDDDKKEAYKKLVKVGIRTAWAKACITEGLTAMAESREPNYPPFPAV